MAFRLGTNAVASSENASSPRWLVPVLRASHDAPFGTLFGNPLRGDLGGVSDGVAGQHRLQPAQVAKAGRGPPHHNLLAARDGLLIWRWPFATKSFMHTEPTCQPDAASPPNNDLRPSSSSR